MCVTVSGRQRAVCQHTLPSGHTIKSPLVHAPAIASHTVRGNNGWPLRWRGHGAPSPRLMGAATTSTSRCARQWAAVATAHRHRSSCHPDRHRRRRRHRSSPLLAAAIARHHRSSPPLVASAPPRHRSSPPLIASAHRQRSSPVRLRSSPPFVAIAARPLLVATARRRYLMLVYTLTLTRTVRGAHTDTHTHTHAHARAREYTHATLSTKQSTSAQRSDRMTRLAVCSVYSSS